MQKVKDLINEIKQERENTKNSNHYNTRSIRDEVSVMKAILNDKEYEVSIYNNNGLVGTYNPSKSIRNMMGNIIAETTGISKIESEMLMDNYEFSNSNAKDMINFSKEFINTYLKTGRKLPLGFREKSNISLVQKIIPEKTVYSPEEIGEDKDGNKIFKNSKETKLKEYESIKVYNPYPLWMKNQDKE